MRSFHHAVLYGIGGLLLAIAVGDAVSVAMLGSLGDIVLTATGCVSLGLPLFLDANEAWRQHSAEKIESADYASRQAMIREIKTMDHEHSRNLEIVATELGRVSERLTRSNDKILRMTTRPRVRGQFAPKEAALSAPEISATDSSWLAENEPDVSSIPR
jgi:hypothetical protein